jgi:hypothetical protein
MHEPYDEPASYTAERHSESIANISTTPLRKRVPPTPVNAVKREESRLAQIKQVNETDAQREQDVIFRVKEMIASEDVATAASKAAADEVIYKQDLREISKDDDAEKIKIRDRIAASQTWSDDYEYDCIVVVTGHSSINHYEIDKLPVNDRMEQVTIMLTDPGYRCITGEPPLQIIRDLFGETPSVILSHLNSNLKDRPTRTTDLEIQDTFLDSYKFTSGLISGDKKHYFNRSWDFF